MANGLKKSKSAPTISYERSSRLQDVANGTNKKKREKRATRLSATTELEEPLGYPPSKRQKIGGTYTRTSPISSRHPRSAIARDQFSAPKRPKNILAAHFDVANGGISSNSDSKPSILHHQKTQSLANSDLPSVEDEASTSAERKRKLRSQDGGSRSKSDLAYYFPNYEEMVSLEPLEPEFLNLNTPILVVDDDSDKKPTSEANPTTPTKVRRPRKLSGKNSALLPGSSLLPAETSSPKIHNAQRVDFSSVEKGARQSIKDALEESNYIKAHKREERREKQQRNIDKMRAQHERDHLERLLDGLKGPDWLRVMGISGITESDKKSYEPKRDVVIHEVVALLEKFRCWREEEKRMKTKREHSAQLTAEATAKDSRESEEGAQQEQHAGDLSDSDEPPDLSDVDAWAARQLRQEAISAKGGRLPGSRKVTPVPQAAVTPAKSPLESQKPFTSFYSKPHLRTAAIGSQRRSGRTVSAFGQPLPTLATQEFALPDDVLTSEARIASARSKRRRRREHQGTDKKRLSE
ncbi:MAG: hypothetical protein M1825_000675 [Sarcosagium campestre]|nr:MAG: hypothetical protein M1825_000675 [Sarcosagium campestre]